MNKNLNNTLILQIIIEDGLVKLKVKKKKK